MTQKFRIWTSTGEPQTVEGDKVEFIRKPDGLAITVKTIGQKPVKFTGAVGLTTVVEEKQK